VAVTVKEADDAPSTLRVYVPPDRSLSAERTGLAPDALAITVPSAAITVKVRGDLALLYVSEDESSPAAAVTV
jgi:hypothetical protein